MPETDSGTPSPGVLSPSVDLSHEAGAGPWELALVALVVAVAVAYLARVYFGRRRSACASCGKAGHCPVSLPTASTEPGGTPRG